MREVLKCLGPVLVFCLVVVCISGFFEDKSVSKYELEQLWDENEYLYETNEQLVADYNALLDRCVQLERAYECLSDGVKEVLKEMEYSDLYNRYKEVEDWYMYLSMDWSTCN